MAAARRSLPHEEFFPGGSLVTVDLEDPTLVEGVEYRFTENPWDYVFHIVLDHRGRTMVYISSLSYFIATGDRSPIWHNSHIGSHMPPGFTEELPGYYSSRESSPGRTRQLLRGAGFLEFEGFSRFFLEDPLELRGIGPFGTELPQEEAQTLRFLADVHERTSDRGGHALQVTPQEDGNFRVENPWGPQGLFSASAKDLVQMVYPPPPPAPAATAWERLLKDDDEET